MVVRGLGAQRDRCGGGNAQGAHALGRIRARDGQRRRGADCVPAVGDRLHMGADALLPGQGDVDRNRGADPTGRRRRGSRCRDVPWRHADRRALARGGQQGPASWGCSVSWLSGRSVAGSPSRLILWSWRRVRSGCQLVSGGHRRDGSGAIPRVAQKAPLSWVLSRRRTMQGLMGGFVGMADYMAMESLSHLGIRRRVAAPVKFALCSSGHRTGCARYLRASPNRPSDHRPQSLCRCPEWMIASGCPAAVVKPERWIVLDIDPAWFERSLWQDGQWSIPDLPSTERPGRGSRQVGGAATPRHRLAADNTDHGGTGLLGVSASADTMIPASRWSRLSLRSSSWPRSSLPLRPPRWVRSGRR